MPVRPDQSMDDTVLGASEGQWSESHPISCRLETIRHSQSPTGLNASFFTLQAASLGSLKQRRLTSATSHWMYSPRRWPIGKLCHKWSCERGTKTYLTRGGGDAYKEIDEKSVRGTQSECSIFHLPLFIRFHISRFVPGHHMSDRTNEWVSRRLGCHHQNHYRHHIILDEWRFQNNSIATNRECGLRLATHFRVA